MTFKEGEEVEWNTQSAGHYRTHRGIVRRVVPAGQSVPPLSKNRNPGGARDHESYVVRVPGRGLYWPRVKSLRPVAPETAP